MTLDEKIGQMTQPDQAPQRSDRYRDHWPRLRPQRRQFRPQGRQQPQAWTDLYDRLQEHALKTRLNIPLLYGVDAVHGHNNVLGAVIFPHNIGLGCTRNPALVEKVEHITAEEVRATGIQWAFAPCVTVPQDVRWGRTYEGFSEDPELCKSWAARGPRLARRDLAIRSPSWPAPNTTSAMAAPPIGSVNAQRQPASIRATRASTKPRCAASTCRAMSPPSKPASAPSCPPTAVGTASNAPANKHLLTDILKNELGFEGFLISDYNADRPDRPGLQKGRRHLHQCRHGHGDGARALQGIHRRS